MSKQTCSKGILIQLGVSHTQTNKFERLLTSFFKDLSTFGKHLQDTGIFLVRLENPLQSLFLSVKGSGILDSFEKFPTEYNFTWL